MSRIDELIAQHCPNGVEFKTLGELLRIKNGKDHKPLGDGDIPVYGSGGIMRYVDTAAAEGPSVLIPRKGSLGNIFYVEGPFWVVDTIFRTEIDLSQVEPKFVYHQLLTMKLGEMNQAGGVPSQTQTVLSSLRIPVPPLEVQREIVRVLDQFTQLEAELEAELEARRRQYEHYRVVLLNSSDDGGVRDVSLGEIIRLNFGARITKKDNAGTIYPVYGGGGESFRTDAFNREDEWVISRFAMSANCVRRVTGKFWMLDSGFTFDVTDATVDKDFVGQLLLSMQPTIFATSTQSAQKNIDVDGFKRLRVQIPSLDTQRRVASALANFDGIVNDLSSGLPAELAARRKQYEYYRDKLLTFEEAAA
ncbi:restriction endonuclease subunit S [Microbacterium maritypicum]